MSPIRWVQICLWVVLLNAGWSASAEYIYRYTGPDFNVWAPNRYDVTVPYPTPGGPNTPPQAFSEHDHLSFWFTVPSVLTPSTIGNIKPNDWSYSDGISTLDRAHNGGSGISITISSLSHEGVPVTWQVWAVSQGNQYGGSSYRSSIWFEPGPYNQNDLSLYDADSLFSGDWNAGAYVYNARGMWSVTIVPEPKSSDLLLGSVVLGWLITNRTSVLRCFSRLKSKNLLLR
jgi:hypothetical protein